MAPRGDDRRSRVGQISGRVEPGRYVCRVRREMGNAGVGTGSCIFFIETNHEKKSFTARYKRLQCHSTIASRARNRLFRGSKARLR